MPIFTLGFSKMGMGNGQRDLVNKMKERALAEPEMRFFIKGGEICSVAKTVN